MAALTTEGQAESGLQGRFDNDALDRRQAEQLFREHLNTLHKRNMDGYIALLEKVGSLLSGHFKSCMCALCSYNSPEALT